MGPMGRRRVQIGGYLMSLALSLALYYRGHRLGGVLLGVWAPPFFALGERLREAIEEGK
jgi:hypothetical protein